MPDPYEQLSAEIDGTARKIQLALREAYRIKLLLFIKRYHNGKPSRLAKAIGISPGLLHHWLYLDTCPPDMIMCQLKQYKSVPTRLKHDPVAARIISHAKKV